MATIIPAHPTSHNVAALLPKLQDADSDFRFMSLNDLHAIFSTASSSLLMHDPGVAARAVEGILKALDDQNGEVQNLAVKWYARCLINYTKWKTDKSPGCKLSCFGLNCTPRDPTASN